MADKYVRLREARQAIMRHCPQAVLALDALSSQAVCIGTCADCALGHGPLSAGGVEGKCICTRTQTYEKSTHYCAEWRNRNANS